MTVPLTLEAFFARTVTAGHWDSSPTRTTTTTTSTTTTTDLRTTDVLLGRGHRVRAWEGNVRFRELVAAYRHLYTMAAKGDKRRVGLLVLDQIRELGGRFVEKIRICGNDDDDDDDDDILHDDLCYFQSQGHFQLVPHEKALKKTCQALRERRFRHLELSQAPQPRQLEQLSSGRGAMSKNKNSADAKASAPSVGNCGNVNNVANNKTNAIKDRYGYRAFPSVSVSAAATGPTKGSCHGIDDEQRGVMLHKVYDGTTIPALAGQSAGRAGTTTEFQEGEGTFVSATLVGPPPFMPLPPPPALVSSDMFGTISPPSLPLLASLPLDPPYGCAIPPPPPPRHHTQNQQNSETNNTNCTASANSTTATQVWASQYCGGDLNGTVGTTATTAGAGAATDAMVARTTTEQEDDDLLGNLVDFLDAVNEHDIDSDNDGGFTGKEEQELEQEGDRQATQVNVLAASAGDDDDGNDDDGADGNDDDGCRASSGKDELYVEASLMLHRFDKESRRRNDIPVTGTSLAASWMDFTVPE